MHQSEMSLSKALQDRDEARDRVKQLSDNSLANESELQKLVSSLQTDLSAQRSKVNHQNSVMAQVQTKLSAKVKEITEMSEFISSLLEKNTRLKDNLQTMRSEN